MRMPLTLLTAVLVALAAGDAAAQQPSARLALRVSVVKSCGVTTNVTGSAPAQVTCSRSSSGNAPEAIMSLSSSDRATSAVPQATSTAAPQVTADSATGDTPAPRDAAETAESTERPAEIPADPASADAPARPVHQVVTINF